MVERRVARQPPFPAAVGVDDVDLDVAIGGCIGAGNELAVVVTLEGDLLPVGRPGRPRERVARQPPLAASVGVHHVERDGATATARGVHGPDESELRACRSGGKAGPCGERGGSILGLCAALEDREDRDSDERHQRRDGPVDAPPAPGALSRLLDQRLDQGLELLAVDGIARAEAGEAGQ